MAKALPNASKSKRQKRNRLRYLSLAAALLGGVLWIAAFAIYSGHRAVSNQADSVPSLDAGLPSLDLTGADPAVAAAVEAARAAVHQSPRSASAWGRLGMVLGAHNLAAEASACLQQAEQLDPHEGRWPYYQGTEFCLNDPEVAIAKLQRAVELLVGRSDVARLRLGELLLRQGRLAEAEEQFRRVLQQDSGNARAHLNLARIARERGELQAGLQHLTRPRGDVHTRQAAHLLAAEIQQRLGDALAASHERQLAAGLPKDRPWPDPLAEEILRLRTGKPVRLAAAAHLLGQGQVHEAADMLRRIVQEDPESDWAWLLLGRALLGQQKLADAAAALRHAVQLAPASMEAHFYLGVALLLQGEPQAAALCFRQAAAIQPDFAEAHHNLAHCLLRQGDRTGASAAFRVALSCKPNYLAAHMDLADLLLQQGQNAEALIHARSAVELNPADARARKLLEQAQRLTR